MKIKPKPLSNDELAEIMKDVELAENDNSVGVHTFDRFQRIIERLLGAEKYWREEIKDSDDMPSDECPFCWEFKFDHQIHSIDCPWLLAQQY